MLFCSQKKIIKRAERSAGRETGKVWIFFQGNTEIHKEVVLGLGKSGQRGEMARGVNT